MSYRSVKDFVTGLAVKVRNVVVNTDENQQVVSRAKSDGTYLDDEATETTQLAMRDGETLYQRQLRRSDEMQRLDQIDIKSYSARIRNERASTTDRRGSVDRGSTR